MAKLFQNKIGRYTAAHRTENLGLSVGTFGKFSFTESAVGGGAALSAEPQHCRQMTIKSIG
jgi:hypothetical protein